MSSPSSPTTPPLKHLQSLLKDDDLAIGAAEGIPAIDSTPSQKSPAFLRGLSALVKSTGDVFSVPAAGLKHVVGEINGSNEQERKRLETEAAARQAEIEVAAAMAIQTVQRGKLGRKQASDRSLARSQESSRMQEAARLSEAARSRATARRAFASFILVLVSIMLAYFSTQIYDTFLAAEMPHAIEPRPRGPGVIRAVRGLLKRRV